jgi:general secretion pathway protein D
MGGLMEDVTNQSSDGVPGLSSLPGLGNLFTGHDDTRNKTELVVFLRPLVVKDASIAGDYSHYSSLLPGQEMAGAAPIATDEPRPAAP